MAGNILDTLGIYDADSDEATELENLDCSNQMTENLTADKPGSFTHQITEEPQELRAPKLLGTFATDPVSGASVHFCRKSTTSGSFHEKKSHSAERSFLKLIEATEVHSQITFLGDIDPYCIKKKFPDLSLGPVYGEKIVEGMACGTGQLWVDKYAPQKFTDLVSNDVQYIRGIQY